MHKLTTTNCPHTLRFYNATVRVLLLFLFIYLRRYNEETKFSVTPSFVLTHSSDSMTDECVSTKLGVTENFVSSLYLLIQSSTIKKCIEHCLTALATLLHVYLFIYLFIYYYFLNSIIILLTYMDPHQLPFHPRGT